MQSSTILSLIGFLLEDNRIRIFKINKLWLTNHYLEYIKGANDFEIIELLIISDLLKVSYHACEDHNSNVNMNSFSFYVTFMSKICHKI